MFATPNSRIKQPKSIVANKMARMNLSKNSFFKPALNILQKKCAHSEEQKLQMKGESNASGGMTALSIVHDVVKSGGQPLDAGTRNFFEPKFGHDFSNVKIHNDPLAHQSSKDINALAYTHGQHIVFANGQYQPNSDSGKQLLAHELTHTLHQLHNSGSLQRKCNTTNPISYYQNAPNYCMDDAFTGLLHNDGKDGEVSFREFPISRKHYRDCPPGHHIIFDKKTGVCKYEHIDSVSPVAYKKNDGTCKLGFQCGFEHGLKDKDVLEGVAKKYHIDPNASLPGEGEPRNTDLF